MAYNTNKMKSLNLEFLGDFEHETTDNPNYPSFRQKRTKPKTHSPILQVEDFTASPSFTPGVVIPDQGEPRLATMPVVTEVSAVDELVAVKRKLAETEVMN